MSQADDHIDAITDSLLAANPKARVVDDITCYGEFKENSNVLVVGTYDDGGEFEQMWAGDESLPQTWTEVVAILQPWAEQNKLIIEELSAC